MWAIRDFPVLAEVTRRIDAGERIVAVDDVAQTTGLSIEDVALAGMALERRGYVRVGGFMGRPVARFEDVSGAAYLSTGLHPDGDDALEQLIATLRQASEQTSDEEERGRLRRAASALSDIAGQVGAGVMTAYLTGFLPH